MIVDPDFPDHWKTRLLVQTLEDEAAPVYVLRLWAHCQLRKQWEFADLSMNALKVVCRFPGNPNKLDASLAASGFIRRNEEGFLTVCNWDEYNASLISAWENGQKGGRPKKPRDNPPVTDGKPTANPSKTGPSTLSNPLPHFFQGKGVRVEGAELPEILDTDEFRQKLDDWVAYKAERREQYKPTGLQQMLTHAANVATRSGLKAVIDAMTRAMANSWKGWDQDSLFKDSSIGSRKSSNYSGPGQTYSGPAVDAPSRHPRT